MIECLLLGDVNNDGLVREEERFAGDGVRQLFTLPRTPVRGITRVLADGINLGPRDFCADLEAGWLSLARPPAAALRVDYVASGHNDLAGVNWAGDKGNFLFYAGPPPVLYVVRGSTGTEPRLEWTSGTAPFGVVESRARDFRSGFVPRAEDLPGSRGMTRWARRRELPG